MIPARKAASTSDGQVALGALDAAPKSSVAEMESCHSSDPNRLCLAVKYAVFAEAGQAPSISSGQAAAAIRTVNGVWSKCNVAFQLENFAVVNPAGDGVRFNIGNYTELDQVRTHYGSEKMLLVALTGAWDRKGSLGDSGANAWTSMPGGPPYGAVIENTVGTFANIVGHELGHYLNLYHRPDTANLMNPIIYSASTALTGEQCQTARDTAKSTWAAMLR